MTDQYANVTPATDEEIARWSTNPDMRSHHLFSLIARIRAETAKNSRAEAIRECIETVKGVFDCMATTTIGSAQYEVVRALRDLIQKEGK